MFQGHFAKSLLVRKCECSAGSFLQASLDIIIWTLRALSYFYFFKFFCCCPPITFVFKEAKAIKQLTCYVVAMLKYMIGQLMK